jgi:hypothetical protein
MKYNDTFTIIKIYILHITSNIHAKEIYQEICDMINQSLSHTVKVSASLTLYYKFFVVLLILN